MKAKTENILKELQTGDIIGFYTPFKVTNLMSYLSATIRFFTKSRYNHSGIYVENWGVGFIDEARQKGVNMEIASRRLKGKYIKVLRLKDKYQKPEKDIATKANSVLGYTRYDFFGLWYQLRFLLSNKKKWSGPKTRKEAMKRMYCHEYSAWVHEEVFPDWWKVDVKALMSTPKAKIVFEGKLI
jgi:hypothetical protein